MTTIAVIGGGLIGSAAAAWLVTEGFELTVFERDPEGRPASVGNAGILALPEISPLARVSTLMSVPRWLMDPLGPLTLRVQDLPSLTPWMARFTVSARGGQVERATAALSFLMKTALMDHLELARRASLPTLMHHNGALYIYDTTRSFDAALQEWRERGSHGVDYREVPVSEARAMVPALKGPFAHAIFTPDSWSVTDPRDVLMAFRSALKAGGGRLETAAVDAIVPLGEGIAVVTSTGQQTFDRVLIAGGVWSRDLVRKLGLNVLLETERGYNTTFADPPLQIAMPVFAADHGFVLSPLRNALRVGGAVELAAVDAPANFARAAAMRARMRRYVPDLPETGGSEWMGCRPSTPDSLPVIGPDPRDPRVVFAFGHGHLGLTLSAVTARHAASLLAGRRRDRSLEAFGIERFQ